MKINSRTVLWLVYLGACMCSRPCIALTTSWTNATGGNWSIPGNWSQGVPGVNDTAAIQLNGSYTVTVNVSVNIEALLLGAASGTQTVNVLNPFDCGQTSIACSIGVNGILDLTSPFTTSTSSIVGLVNHGFVILRQDDGILNMSSTRLDNYATGTVILEGLCAVNNVTSVENFGALISLGAESVIDGDVNNLAPTGLVSINEHLATHDFANDAVVQVAQASLLYLDSLDSGTAAIFGNSSTGVIELYPGSVVDGRSTNLGEPAVQNSGDVVVIDTLLADDWATIEIPFEQYSPDGLLSLLSGKLELLDTTYLDDSVNVASACTLKVHGLYLPSGGSVAGSGVIQFAGDAANLAGTAPYVRGTWGFTGSLLVASATSFPTTVDFAADGGPAVVALRALKLAKELCEFTALPYPGVTVTADTIIQNGGVLNGLIAPQDFYHWTRGTLKSDSGDDFIIPPGANLVMDSTFGKTLETIALVVEGGATFSGSGVLTLSDSARLASQPTGTLNFESGFDMTGSGDFYNSGQSNFDATSDTITIDVFVTNTTIARTPGTIDILGGKVVWPDGAINKGTIIIHAGATLIVYGNFLNDVSGSIQGTGTLNVTNCIFTNYGLVSPSLSPGLLTVTGNMICDSQSTLSMELRGTLPADYDRLNVSGQVTLDGSLNLHLQNGYLPALNDTLHILSYASASDSFDIVTGTSIGNGQFLEIAYGANGITNYVCNGVSDLSVPASISDTIWQASAPVDTLELEILNSGHCPLTYSITVGSLSPPSPVWLTVVPSGVGTSANPLRRSDIEKAKLRVNTTGGATGTYTGSITIHSNDPDDSAHVVPITLEVIHGPDVWDIGGGSNDFDNFAQAVSYLNSTTISFPQVFNAYPGIYNESITISPIAGASATNTVTFRKVIEALVKVQSAASSVLRFNGADHVVWDGIDIEHLGGGAGSAIVDTAGADSNIVRNCLLTNAQTSAQTQGVFMRSASGPATTNDYNRFENLTIEGFTTAVLLGSPTGVVTSQTGNIVSNCVIQNCGLGIVAGCQKKALLKEIKCSLSHPHVSTVKGIEIGQLNSGDTVRVEGNEIHDLTGSLAYGINLVTFNSNSMVWVYNNMLHSWNAGITQAIVVNEGSRAGVHFNSIYLNESPVATFNYGIGGGGTSVINASNNIIYSDATSDTTIAIAFGSLVTMASNHNCFYGISSRFMVGRITSTNYPTLAAWQGTGRDLNSLFDVPGFASALDLHIDGYYTTCDAQGVVVGGIAIDMDGELRDLSTPDIGADEFVGLAGPVSNLVIRRAPASNNVRLNWSSVAGAASYHVYASTSVSTLTMTPAFYLGSSSTNSFTHAGAVSTPNVKYYYLVRPSTLP